MGLGWAGIVFGMLGWRDRKGRVPSSHRDMGESCPGGSIGLGDFGELGSMDEQSPPFFPVSQQRGTQNPGNCRMSGWLGWKGLLGSSSSTPGTLYYPRFLQAPSNFSLDYPSLLQAPSNLSLDNPRDPRAAITTLGIPSRPLPLCTFLHLWDFLPPAPFPRIREPFPPFQPSSLSRIRSVPNLRTENPTLTTSSSLQNIRSPPSALLQAPPLGRRQRAPDNAGKKNKKTKKNPS